VQKKIERGREVANTVTGLCKNMPAMANGKPEMGCSAEAGREGVDMIWVRPQGWTASGNWSL